MDKQIQTDDISRGRMTEYLIKREYIPYPVRWRTRDNTYLDLIDANFLLELSNSMMEF